MLLLPAWWIQLQEHTAFRLSLSIRTVQDTTVKMNATENGDPEKAVGRVVTLSDLIITRCNVVMRDFAHKQLQKHWTNCHHYIHDLPHWDYFHWGFSHGVSEWLSVLPVSSQSGLWDISLYYYSVSWQHFSSFIISAAMSRQLPGQCCLCCRKYTLLYRTVLYFKGMFI